ncbi:hypothetical protein DXG03_000301 [Asterophora parasitica]|uniref:Uncharacterized protein n=1 Tax=Asterophora parasitica TaxID=117018 RepID=A0A9P7GL28_9AGAR|nr:hypothetical protein DXG03_000301 [Asterophora parasitica]
MDSNPKIASLAARIVESNHADRRRHNRDEEEYEDDDEALFAELEEEIENDSNAALREQGLEVLRREMERMKEMKQNEHGSYTEIGDEKEVVRVSALIGFEQLGNSDKFDTALLELRLLQCVKQNLVGVIQKAGNSFSVDPVYKVASRRNEDEDDVFDLDD